ncbi:major facilitator superfamily domain-containing protein [Xylariomycetidae sp. FL0641]|nr:major facilitator superfamily domain-containing protein [Xylariomycetidae sp. FL0641]
MGTGRVADVADVVGGDALEALPGTRRLFDENGSVLTADEGLLRHGDIVLIPQPTDSPNDPLNWSLPRKTWHTALVCFTVALTAATSNIAGSAADGVKEDYGWGYSYFNTGAAVLFIGIGYWTLLSSPGVHLYGRRILYLVCMVWGFVGNIWFARLQTTADIVWTQLFVGASESVAEAAVQLSLLDIWFEHQNGTSLGFYTLATSIGTYLGPLIAGYIADSFLGWRWIGYFSAIVSGGTFFLLLLTLEETEFHRERFLLQPHSSNDPARDPEKTAAGSDGLVSRGGAAPETQGGGDDLTEKRHRLHPQTMAEVELNRQSVSYARPKTIWQRLRIITPAPNLQGLGLRQYLNRLWHTMRVFSFPAVWFAGLQWGVQNICLSFYLTVEEDNWYGPPWNYGDVAVGNMNIPSIIGSIIGCVYGGYFSDKFMIFMTRRNRGIMESEYRLYLMALCVIVFPAGMLLFGIGSAHGWDWPVPYVGLGFIGFGYGCAGDLSLTYLADSYPDMVLEGMVGVAVINNTLAMIFTFVASYWLATGIQDCFIELAVVSFVIMALSFPMIYWGKAARRWTRGRYLMFLEIRDGLD